MASRRSCRTRRKVDYASCDGGEESDDDFTDFTPPQKKRKGMIGNEEKKLKNKRSADQLLMTSTQTDEPNKKNNQQRLSIEEKIFQRSLNKTLEESCNSTSNNSQTCKNLTMTGENTGNWQTRGSTKESELSFISTPSSSQELDMTDDETGAQQNTVRRKETEDSCSPTYSTVQVSEELGREREEWQRKNRRKEREKSGISTNNSSYEPEVISWETKVLQMRMKRKKKEMVKIGKETKEMENINVRDESSNKVEKVGIQSSNKMSNIPVSSKIGRAKQKNCSEEETAFNKKNSNLKNDDEEWTASKGGSFYSESEDENEYSTADSELLPSPKKGVIIKKVLVRKQDKKELKMKNKAHSTVKETEPVSETPVMLDLEPVARPNVELILNPRSKSLVPLGVKNTSVPLSPNIQSPGTFKKNGLGKTTVKGRAWTPPAPAGLKSFTSNKGTISSGTGLRIGLSRNIRVKKPLHSSVIVTS